MSYLILAAVGIAIAAALTLVLELADRRYHRP